MSLLQLSHLRLLPTHSWAVWYSSAFTQVRLLLVLMFTTHVHGKKERISRLFQMNSNKEIPMESIDAGDIGAGVGFKDIRTGDTLCDEDHPIVLESMTFPDTVISIAVEPKSQADIAKLDNGLAKLG